MLQPYLRVKSAFILVTITQSKDTISQHHSKSLPQIDCYKLGTYSHDKFHYLEILKPVKEDRQQHSTSWADFVNALDSWDFVLGFIMQYPFCSHWQQTVLLNYVSHVQCPLQVLLHNFQLSSSCRHPCTKLYSSPDFHVAHKIQVSVSTSIYCFNF